MRATLLLLLILASCCPRQYLSGVSTDTTTSISNSYTEHLRDSLIKVSVPREHFEDVIDLTITQPRLLDCSRRAEIKDTTSRLESATAISVATIKDGKLWHSLTSKDTTLTAVAQLKDTRQLTDSVKTVFVKDTVIEVQHSLYWWQTALCYIGVIALLWLAYRVAKLIL